MAYSSALRYPLESVAIALVPTIIRALSMIWNICAMPSWTSPSSVPTAGMPSTSPKRTSHVVDTLMPILSSTLVTKAPLRSPSSPVSRSKWNLGTTNSDRPFVPGPAPSGRASTKWTMLSAMSCSAEVMKRLTPVMCQVPSSCRTAFARPAPTSEPASGSVRIIVAPHSLSTISFASRCWSGVPCV